MSFVFKDYSFDKVSKTATFLYENNRINFKELAKFNDVVENYDEEVLDKALFLAFMLIGTSYFKTFPTSEVNLEKGNIDQWQSEFFNAVFQDGMSQFAFENNLKRADLARFIASGEGVEPAQDYTVKDSRPLVLQSGGKDSLLLAETLKSSGVSFDSWYFGSSDKTPDVIKDIGNKVVTAKRSLDVEGLKKAEQAGGLNGHVPITYIVFSIALIQVVLLSKGTILAAIGHEGEEPYGLIDDLPVRHQWAKIWSAEIAFADYVKKYVSPNIKVGSALRKYSELKIAELFVEKCWAKYSRKFSSCNIGNYKQGQDNQVLGWCGNCAKCANSFLLFAPFVEPAELIDVFNGENLFKKESLQQIFKGLLDIDDVAKLFECVGETDELRLAYNMAHRKSDEYALSFDVPESDFDYQKEYPTQTLLV